MAQEKANVIILGGGIVGSLLSVILGSNGLSVFLVEKKTLEDLSSDYYDGRSYALNEGTKNLLDFLGIWDEIKEKVQSVSKVLLQQGIETSRLQPFEISLFDYEIDSSSVFYMIEDRFLRRVILNKVKKETNISHLTSKVVQKQSIVGGLIEIKLNGGITLKGDLAIGADGFPSKSAGRAKVRNFGWTYNQSSIVGVVRHEYSHENEAIQFFLPAGPLAILPLIDNRSCYVWTMGTKEAKGIYELDGEKFLEKLIEVFNNCRGKLVLDTPKSIFPISLALARNLIKERFALIGDSAHNIHPIAGQGLNLGIRDLACLSEVLILASRNGEDIGGSGVLGRYSKWRRSDILSLSLFTDITNKVFSTDNFMLHLSRGLAFNLIDKSPILKKYLMKEASGSIGEIPKLLEGKEI